MNRTHWLGYTIVSVLCLTVLLGCQQRPAVPTLPPQPTDPVIVVVVTATSQPTLMPTNTPPILATITPLPGLTAAVTRTVTATTTAAVQPTTASVQPTRAQSAQPTQPPTAPPTESAPPTAVVQASFPPPSIFSPEGISFRDGDTVKFEFSSVGPLASDQCYRFDMTLGNPTGPGGVGDWWVPMSLCGNQANAGDRIVFDLKPGRFRDEPNYGTLLVSADAVIPPTPEYVMRWFVSVVRLVDTNDPVHPNVQAIGPNSSSLQNTFFR